MITARELDSVVLKALGTTAAACLVAGMVGSHLVYNWTASVPIGLYWLTRGEQLQRGDVVAFGVPPRVEQLVEERRYLPRGALLLKPVAAIPGDQVCTDSGAFVVNGRSFGRMLEHDSERRPMPQHSVCDVVPAGEVYVASIAPMSFDSRSFGPVKLSSIRGKVTPLWTY